MSTQVISLSTAYSWRDLRDGAERYRHFGAYLIAGLLHLIVLYALVTLSPVIRTQVGQVATAINVQLYTIAGGPDSDTDAALYEPPLAADLQTDLMDLDARGSLTNTDPLEQSASDASDIIVPGDLNSSQASPIEPELSNRVEDSDEPEPVSEPVTEPELLPEPDLVPESDLDGAVLIDETIGVQPVQTRPNEVISTQQSPAQLVPTTTNDTVATLQQPPRARLPRGSAAVRFADILAQTKSKLNPEDYRYVELLGGVQGTIEESFCLSSASGNRDAMNCPDEPNPASAELAKYGLMGLGEEPPVFMEDMDRLAFELQSLGADADAVERILLGLAAGRRKAMATDPLIRQMGRDKDNTVDNLGISTDSVTPAKARDPSGGG